MKTRRKKKKEERGFERVTCTQDDEQEEAKNNHNELQKRNPKQRKTHGEVNVSPIRKRQIITIVTKKQKQKE